MKSSGISKPPLINKLPCIYNNSDDWINGFSGDAAAVDLTTEWLSNIINLIYTNMGDLDEAIIGASSVEEFQQIFLEMEAIQGLCDELNDTGIMAIAITLREDIDLHLKDQLKRQYNAIQYLRKKVYRTTNSKKYGIIWPAGPQNILNEYVPGCTFDNYIPKED